MNTTRSHMTAPLPLPARLHTPGRHAAAPGFTLLELLVVVGIIAILLALVVFGGGAARTRARINTTSTVLAQLDTLRSALETEQFRAKQVFSDKVSDITATGGRSTAFALWDPLWSTEVDLITPDHAATNACRWLFAFSAFRQASELTQFQLKGFGQDQRLSALRYNSTPATPTDGGQYLVDAFANPIMLIQLPRAADAAGTGFETRAAARFGAGRGSRYYFVSAGPDAAFGDLANSEKLYVDQAGDNIYSYEAIR